MEGLGKFGVVRLGGMEIWGEEVGGNENLGWGGWWVGRLKNRKSETT